MFTADDLNNDDKLNIKSQILGRNCRKYFFHWYKQIFLPFAVKKGFHSLNVLTDNGMHGECIELPGFGRCTVGYKKTLPRHGVG